MEARLVRLAVIVGALFCLAANYRTQNFLVSAASESLAREMGDAAETFRHDLAVEWLGAALPAWSEPCPIRVLASPELPAGGETSFLFTAGQPHGWRMIVQGSRERVLDSVLPHEITHTIFATHFGCPLPRWADEGACTTVEHASERRKQDKWLIEFLTTDRGIAFNEMYAMREYPSDILPLYSQGYSVSRFLIAQGGKQKFIKYVGAGLDSRNWTAATRQYYGFASLSELQVTWLEWVRRGSPPLDEGSVLVDLLDTGPNSRSATPTSGPQAQLVSSSTSAGERGWYARQRDRAYAERRQAQPAAGDDADTQATARPPEAQRVEPRVLESSRTAPFEPVLRR
jgi:hypothetical protein